MISNINWPTTEPGKYQKSLRANESREDVPPSEDVEKESADHQSPGRREVGIVQPLLQLDLRSVDELETSEFPSPPGATLTRKPLPEANSRTRRTPPA